MSLLSDEDRKRIYEEEKARHESEKNPLPTWEATAYHKRKLASGIASLIAFLSFIFWLIKQQ